MACHRAVDAKSNVGIGSQRVAVRVQGKEHLPQKPAAAVSKSVTETSIVLPKVTY